MENEQLMRQERRQMKREEKASNQRSFGRRRVMRRIFLWGGSIAVLVLLVWGMSKLAANTTLPSDGGTLAVPVSAEDRSYGPEDAPIVLVEYSDFQCPACASFHPVIQQALEEEELAGRVRFVYRHFPLSSIHANAELAAQAAEAAGQQGLFWEMHDRIFEGQQSWERLSTKGATDLFRTYAEEIGADGAQWEADLSSDVVREKVQSDFEGGVAARVNATPTFFVNGEKMPQPNNYQQFLQYLIDAGATNS